MHESSLKTRRKLPSLKRHGLSAALVLAIIAISVFGFIQFGQKDPTPEYPQKTVQLPKPVIAATKPQTPDLPDLLAKDNIPQDENPTARLEMIGGPDVVPNASAGPRPAQILPRSNSPVSAKTILIDGQPVGNGDTARANAPLVQVPIKGLSQMSPYGMVPAIAPDGRTVLRAYARPFTPDPQKKYISIIVGGLGLNPVVTNRAIQELPGAVTLSFAAEAPGLQNWINKARAHGHEVILEFPMDGGGPKPGEPGANLVLSASNPDSINIRRVIRLLSRAEGYFAVTNYGGNTLVQSEKSMAPIFAQLTHSGLGFIYDGGLPSASLLKIARKTSLKAVSAQAYIDETSHDRGRVKENLLRLQTRTNTPIGMGFSYGGTIDGILDWMKAKPAGTALAPASYKLLQAP